MLASAVVPHVMSGWPQAQTSPLSASARVCIPPAATCLTRSDDSVLLGTGTTGVATSVVPVCRFSLPPLACGHC